MDNAKFGQFAELDSYESRREFEAWLDAQTVVCDDSPEWPDDMSGEEDNS